MDNKNSFVFYRSFYEALQDLNDKDRLKLYDATCNLALNDVDTQLKGIANTVFKLIKPQVIANTERYTNGKKGGRPKKETTGYGKKKTIGFENKKTTGYDSEKPNENDNANVNENDNVNANVNVNAFGLFETEFARPLTPIEMDLINQWENEHDTSIIKMALREAIKHGARNFKYVEAILNNWKSNSVRTVTEAQEYMAKREKEMAVKKGGKQLPGWFYEQDEPNELPSISDDELMTQMQKLREHER